MFGKTGNLRCVKVWFHAFSVKRNQNKGSLIPGNPGVPGDRRGSQCTPNSPCPYKKNCLLIDISPDLPTPNILFSPSSQHFLSNFSLLPTFSGHFSLLPIVYLPPLYRPWVLLRFRFFWSVTFLLFYKSKMKEITGQSNVCSISPFRATTATKQKQKQEETYVRNFSWYVFLYKVFIARKSSEAPVVLKGR